MNKMPLYFSIFCFIMAFSFAYKLGNQGLLSVVLFLVIGIISFLKYRQKKDEESKE